MNRKRFARARADLLQRFSRDSLEVFLAVSIRGQSLEKELDRLFHPVFFVRVDPFVHVANQFD
jgi:hypothetical protein